MGHHHHKQAKLHVTIHEAKGLKGGGLLRSLSPYCLVQVGNRKLKTTAIKGGGHSHKFDHGFTFKLRGDEEVMFVTLLDKDSASPETVLGSGEISLLDLDGSGKYHGEIPLKRKNGKSGGVVKVTMKLKHGERMQSPAASRTPSRHGRRSVSARRSSLRNRSSSTSPTSSSGGVSSGSSASSNPPVVSPPEPMRRSRTHSERHRCACHVSRPVCGGHRPRPVEDVIIYQQPPHCHHHREPSRVRRVRVVSSLTPSAAMRHFDASPPVPANRHHRRYVLPAAAAL